MLELCAKIVCSTNRICEAHKPGRTNGTYTQRNIEQMSVMLYGLETSQAETYQAVHKTEWLVLAESTDHETYNLAKYVCLALW